MKLSSLKNWLNYLKNNVVREILIILVCIILGYFISQYFLTEIRGKVYNCELAEISPDIPIKVKEECRRLRSKNENSTSK